MLLNAADLLQSNKNKIFKRLLERKTPLNVFTTLSFTKISGVSPSTNVNPDNTSKHQDTTDESLYCLPQDIESAVQQLQQLPTGSASPGSSTGSTNQHTKPPVIAIPPIPRLSSVPSIDMTNLAPPTPRIRSQSEDFRTKKKDRFFKNLTKHARKQDHARTSSFSASSTVQEVPLQANRSTDCDSDDFYEDMENLARPERDANSSFDEDSLLYEDYMGVNRNKTEEDLRGKKDEIEVKTLALCWWSEKLNKLTDTTDYRIELDPVFRDRKLDVLAATVLLSGGTILTPSIGSVEVGILFGLIYDIPELVQVNSQWIKKHIKPSNFLDIIKMYDKIKDYGSCSEIIHIIRKFIENTDSSEITGIISTLIEHNQDWVQIIGLNYIPIKVLRAPLTSGTVGDPNKMSKMVRSTVEEELNKTHQELDKSPLFIKLISPDFTTFFDELANSVTEIGEMRSLFRTEQQLTQKVMSTMMSSSYGSIVGSIKATLERDDLDEEEHGLFEDRQWRRSTARELVLAFQQHLHNAPGQIEGNLIDFVVVEIVLDWIKFNKFDLPAELCVNVLKAIRKLDKLSAMFVDAVIAETHALLGPEAFSYVKSSFNSLPTTYEHVTQRFVLTKNNLELLLLGQHVTLKSECTLGMCGYVGTLSVVTINLENSSVTPIVRLSFPAWASSQPNTEHMHYDFVHWCFADNQHSQLQENVHLLSVMTRTYQEIKNGLSALDGCVILFFAKNIDSVNV